MFSVEHALVKQWYWHRIPNLCEYAIIVIRFFLPGSQLKKSFWKNFEKIFLKKKIFRKIIVFLSISNAQFNLFKSSSFCIKTVFVQFKIAKTKIFLIDRVRVDFGYYTRYYTSTDVYRPFYLTCNSYLISSWITHLQINFGWSSEFLIFILMCRWAWADED